MSNAVVQAALQAIEDRYSEHMTALRSAAETARSVIAGNLDAVDALSDPAFGTSDFGSAPASFHSDSALIPDTPLGGGLSGGLAFDDAPLWQS